MYIYIKKTPYKAPYRLLWKKINSIPARLSSALYAYIYAYIHVCIYIHTHRVCIYVHIYTYTEPIHRPWRKADPLEGDSEDDLFWQQNCKLRLLVYVSHMPKVYEYFINIPLNITALLGCSTEHWCELGQLGFSSYNTQTHRVTPQEGSSPHCRRGARRGDAQAQCHGVVAGCCYHWLCLVATDPLSLCPGACKERKTSAGKPVWGQRSLPE